MEHDSVERSGTGRASGLVRQEMKAKNQIAGPGAHKRTTSGGLLGSLPFLRSAGRDVAPRAAQKRGQEGEDVSGGFGQVKSASLATVLTQGRRRKGSLRKTAILSKGKSRQAAKPAQLSAAMIPQSPDDETPRLLVSPLTSPIEPYASTTTDDDEGMTFYRPTASSSTSSYNPLPLQPPGPSSSLQRRRSNRGPQTPALPTVHTPAEAELAEEEWDYSETEWWGWVVLMATWIVFVVGMGSCLGVWSWAWDVGETPYAPPDLEDDPTLPITGYYPALIVCTAVMAWVWVVVAWVGMKYFRHAKMVGDDG